MRKNHFLVAKNIMIDIKKWRQGKNMLRIYWFDSYDAATEKVATALEYAFLFEDGFLLIEPRLSKTRLYAPDIILFTESVGLVVVEVKSHRIGAIKKEYSGGFVVPYYVSDSYTEKDPILKVRRALDVLKMSINFNDTPPFFSTRIALPNVTEEDWKRVMGKEIEPGFIIFKDDISFYGENFWDNVCNSNALQEKLIEYSKKKAAEQNISLVSNFVDSFRGVEEAFYLNDDILEDVKTEIEVPEMQLVEKGVYSMGSFSPSLLDNEEATAESLLKPKQRVLFTYDFYISKDLITFEEYFAFCNATKRKKPYALERGDGPVINLSWWDAIAFCNWLSEKEKLPKAYNSKGNFLDKGGRVTTDPSKVVGYRLPTEAEWEYAAKKGMELPILMEEWCSDYLEKFSNYEKVNPYESDTFKAVRGQDLRYFSEPSSTSQTGFRICRTVPYVGKNRPPLAPYNPTPSHEAVAGSTSVTLVWESYDPDGDVMAYDVYFDTNSNPTTKVSANQTETSFRIEGLSYDAIYYWKVVVKDVHGATTEGPVWEFATRDIQPMQVLVEKGSFTMGDTWGDGYNDEKPTHKVTFTYNFYIGKYETTFDEYDAFCEATGRNKSKDEGWGRGQRPVINVSWNDAIAYCNWLSEKEKLPKAYDSEGNLLDKNGNITTDPSKVIGYRLPTEAEWEYAARGGNKSKGYKYSGSDNVDNVAWYWQNSGDKYLTGDRDWDTIIKNNCRTQEIGKKAPNELGLYDMSGNVWEWCSDWYDSGYYSKSPTTNPYNSTAGSFRVLRGGSSGSNATHVRVADRSYFPLALLDCLGFRICRTVP